MILATDQLNAQILIFLIGLLYSCTCFEHCCAHHQDVKLYHTAMLSSHSVVGHPTLRLREDSLSPLSTGANSKHNNNNDDDDDNNNNNNNLLQLGCYPVAVVILHVNKI